MTIKYYSAVKLLMFACIALLIPVGYAHAHSESPNNAPWDACDNKPRSAGCEYKGFSDERYRGTCQRMSEHMMCVKNRHNEKPKTIATGSIEPAIVQTHPIKKESNAKIENYFSKHLSVSQSCVSGFRRCFADHYNVY